MKRFLIILAAAWFLAMGTGLVEFAHNTQHARDDAHRAASSSLDRSQPDESAPLHDDSNCSIHAQLHLPLISTPVVLLLICAGLLVAFVTQLAPVPDGTRIPSRIDCRGPPALV